MFPLEQPVRGAAGIWAGHSGLIVELGKTPRVQPTVTTSKVHVRLEESKLEATEESE